MSVARTLDIESLVAPITGANPSGESLRYAGTYDAIQEARRADDALAQGDWQRATKVSDWRGVIELATTALATRSKDLQLAAWLLEASVKVHGFAGLRDGLGLMRELMERFWDTVYPEVEDGDLEFRAAPIEWINDRLPETVKAVPIARSSVGDQYAWWHWHESRTVENLGRQNPEARELALAEGKISGEEFDKAVAALARAHWEELFETLSEARGELTQLDAAVGERFGRNAPSLVKLKEATEEVRTLIESIVKRKRELEPDATRPGSPVPEGERVPGRDGSVESVDGGMLRDRAAALRQLAEVAAFFRRTEPHSPVAYLVQRAVHWGHMPLEDWLKEVIDDVTVLARVRETLGLKAAERPANE
jgi:type VI secretion system protein ImpA